MRPAAAAWFVLVALAGCASGAEAPAPPSAAEAPQGEPKDAPWADAVRRDRAAVDRDLWRSAIGRDYACAVLGGPHTRPRLLIYVTSETARAAARKLVPQLGAPSHARVRLVSARLRRATMRRISDRVYAKQPKGKGNGMWADVDFEFVDLGRCPRVELTIERNATRAVERWARRAVARFGDDRVSVVRGSQAVLIPAGGAEPVPGGSG